MIRNRHKKKKKLSFKMITDLSNTNQRNILLSDDAAIEKLKAKISWNIKNKKQLTHWVISKLEKLLAVLNELWTKRDVAMSCLNYWQLLKEKIRNAMRLIQKSQTRFDEAWFKLINEMSRNVELHNETKILKKELAQAKKKRDQIIKQLKNIFDLSTFNFIVEKRSTKHSDSSFLTDKKNSTFNDCSLRI